MSLPFHLGLRYQRHMVSLMKTEGRAREVLGVAYPDETDPRARILHQWGMANQSPRRPEPGTINLPLPTRTQTILSYQVTPPVQAALNSKLVNKTPSRRDTQNGVKSRLHLGDHGTELAVNSDVRVRHGQRR